MRLFIAVTIISMLVAFQNCSGKRFGNNPAPTTTAESGGVEAANSGGNYDGKLYSLRDRLNPCAPEDTAITQIHFTGGKYLLNRENCTEMNPPTEIASQSITTDKAGGNFIIFKKQALMHEDASPSAPAPHLICEGTTGTDSAVAMVLRTANGFTGRAISYSGTTVTQDTGSIVVREEINVTIPGYGGATADGSQAFQIYSRGYSYPADQNAKLAFFTGTGLYYKNNQILGFPATQRSMSYANCREQ